MRWRDRISIGSLCASVATSIFVIGGAFRWTQAIVAVFVAVGVAAQLPSRRVLSRLSPLVAALVLATILTAISVLPMPSAIRDALDPVGTALRDDGATLLDLSSWSGLTRDLPGSLRSLCFFLTLLGVAVVTLRITPSERGRYRVLAGVTTCCVLVASIVGIHSVVGATRLYGVYDVGAARPTVLGPLLNENHLGALMAMATCVALGLAMHRRQPSWMRAAWLAGVIACGATAAASGSRGALIALGVSGVVTLGVLVGQRLSPQQSSGRRAREQFATSSLPIAVVAACVVVIAVYTSAGKVTAELGRTSTAEIEQPHSKFGAWRAAKDLIAETPWVGVGRGGFESSFTHIHAAESSVTFSHVENEYIQVVIDWGIPGALLMLAMGLWFAAVAIRHWRDGPLAAGAIGAMAAIAVQSNVDFGIELLGIAVPVTVIAATLAYVPLRETSARPLLRSRGLRSLHVLALLAGAALLLTSATTTLEEEHDALKDDRVTLADVRASLSRHPYDYYGYARAAVLLSRSGNPDSIRLLNHALRLHPTLPDLHRMAARLLLRGGHMDQAAIEYAVALRGIQDPTKLVDEIVATFPPELAAKAIPTDFANPAFMLVLLDKSDRVAIGSMWLTRVAAAHPRDVRMCNMLYEWSLQHHDFRAAEAAGRSCVEMLPDHQTRLSLATLLAREHRHAEVIRLLQDIATWRGRIDAKVEGWLALCDAYTALERLEDAARCLHHLDATGEVSLDQRSVITSRLDQVKDKRRTLDTGSASGSGSASSSANSGSAPSSPPAGSASPH